MNKTTASSAGWRVDRKNRHVYFFCYTHKNLRPKIDMRSVRLDMTKDILKHYGFFEGKNNNFIAQQIFTRNGKTGTIIFLFFL